MQYNYDFHLHHQRVEASQMLEEFESFYYNRNLHNIPWYEKPNFRKVNGNVETAV